MKKETSFERHWFDIAVPRDIEDCACRGVNIYSVDDLQDIMNQNIEMREKNSKIAFKIVEKFTKEFYTWLGTLSVDPLIKEIREMARDCSQREVQKAVKKGYISPDMQEQVEKILHQTFNMFLHQPTKVLKSGAGQPQSDTLVQSIQVFFGLNSKQKKLINTYKCDYQIEKDIKQKDQN
jgi:glutamyl-tRNA reductase